MSRLGRTTRSRLGGLLGSVVALGLVLVSGCAAPTPPAVSPTQAPAAAPPAAQPTAAPAAQPTAAPAAAAAKPAAAPTTAAPAPAVPAPTTAAPAAAPAGQRRLVIAMATEPSTLDPQAVIDRGARVLTGSIFEGLLDRDRSMKIVPMLAESYTAVNDTTWRFKLRKGVKFQNGESFNAEAAAFSVNRIIDKDYKSQRGSYTEGIVGAKVVDESTVDVLTDGIDSVLPIQMSQLAMVPPQAAKDAKAFAQKPIGTGPYMFNGWDRGREIRATAWPEYWGTKPSIKDVAVRIVPDSQTQLAALQAGEVDVVLDLLPEQIALAPKSASVPSTDFSYIQFNSYKKEMSDPRVRIAMNMAIDKDTLAKSVYLGNAVPNNAQHLSPGMIGFNPNLKPYPYNPARARELLKEAGYPNGFSVTLNAPIGRYLKGEETVEYVAAQLGEIGIKAKVELMEWNAYRDAGRIPGTEPKAFDLKYGWNGNEWFDGSRIVSHITCKGTSSKLCNPEVDRLMDLGIKTIDDKQRDQIYQQVWAELNKDPHAIYLLNQNLVYGMSKRVDWQPRQDDEYRLGDMKLTE